MVDIIISVAAKVAEYLVAPIGRQFNYLCTRESNFMKLKNEVENLKFAKDSVQHKVEDAKKKVKKIEPKVEKWQDSVNKIIEKAEQLIEEKEEANNRCFKGYLNLITAYKHSKEASKKVEAVAELLREEENFGDVARTIIHEEIWLRSNKGYEAFESRKSTLNDILKALNDADVHMIGVYGMGGIGKTTLVKEVGREAKKAKLFDEEIFVEISKTPDATKIQEEIANKLGLKFNDETEGERANNLYERLTNEKRILIILDNIWEGDLDFEKIGIPLEDDHEGCKLLLTARDHNVLKRMGAKPFPIDFLDEEESWSLFKKMAGDYIENNEFKSIAKKVVKECGGLPIVIVTIAKALRDKKVSEWKDALRELRRPSPTNFTGVLEEPYLKIELSYKYLKGDELKKTFLLCSLMARGASIFDLLKYATGLDLFGEDILNMEEARNRLDKLVRELKDSCLVLDNYKDEIFSMHDVVRAVAISIARRDQHVIIAQNDDPMEWPHKDKLEKCSKIFLHSSNISELPEVLECPQLEFFHMYDRKSSFTIPVNFFTRMEQLKVLSLIQVQQLSLPLMISLQTLYLHYSKLEDIAIIGELKKLKILSLQGSEIKQLPGEIGELTHLRLLDLSNCCQLEVITPNVLSKLTRLEELYLTGCPIQWEVEGLNVERTKASLNELKHLSCLTSLEINIKDDKILPKSLFSKKLERYKISVGMMGHLSSEREGSRKLKLELNSSICAENFEGLFENVERLSLGKLKDEKNVFCELDKKGFSKLKHLYIQSNSNFQYIVNSMDLAPCDALPHLESLSLFNLINLEKISHQPLTMDSFCKLESIKVNDCKQLETIFSFSHIRCLPQLQSIQVWRCENMKEIFAIEGEDDVTNDEVIGNIEFSQLRSLTLSSLPQLTSFYFKVQTSSTSQANDTTMEDKLHTLMSLFNAKKLSLDRINSDKIWHNQLSTMSSSYQKLTRLTLENCPNLKSVFSASMVKSLEQLQHLSIRSCSVLKEIIAKEEGTEAAPNFVFPRVIDLTLAYLPEFITFYPGICTLECPMLKKLEVYRCDKEVIFSSKYPGFYDNDGERQLEVISEQQSHFMINRNLEELTLGGKQIMMMLQDQFLENYFCRFKVLEVNADDSTNISVEILKRFKNVEALELVSCSYKEMILCRQDGTPARIKKLRMHGLNYLKHLWKQDSILDSVCQKLEILSVGFCSKLINCDILVDRQIPSSASFKNLTVLKVNFCHGLINLVTSSTAKGLVQLREIVISDCWLMVEIVENEEDEAREEIVFNKLKRLSLQTLESLTSFYSGNCILKFPSLEELFVVCCPKMKCFSRGILSTPKLQKVNQYNRVEGCWQGDVNTIILQCNEEKVDSNPKQLTLSGEDISRKWEDHLDNYSLEHEVLEVIKDKSTHIPLRILQKFKDLKRLILKVSSFEEIISREDGEKHARILTQIETLELRGLFHLKYLWKQDYQMDSVLQNLQILQIWYCHNLTNLIPSSASFENLTILNVWHCDGLINLVTSLTAKSLVQLEKVTISYCEMIKEIVANEGDVANEEIVFSKLKSLSLKGLESLTSFCSGNYSFKFPSLEELFVSECPKMKTFSGGVLSIPRLQKVSSWIRMYWNVSKVYESWEGDLNTTIQQLHKKESSKKDWSGFKMKASDDGRFF